MKLKQLLKVTDPKQRVNVQAYAYGFFYGSTVVDGLKTAEDVLKNAYKDILSAEVTYLKSTMVEESDIYFSVLLIQVELCK